MGKYFKLLMALILSSAASASGQPRTAAAAEPEAVCGYGQRFVAVSSGKQQAGLSVDLLAGEVSVNQTVPLRFRVYQSPGDVPVDDLQVEHEKLMHVIGVRDDLGAF